MNSRMLQILQMESLTALKFAELMEVQPSSVSHILSGRNKPGFELISKIMQRMPNINPDWLINGIGAPKRDNLLDIFGYNQSQDANVIKITPTPVIETVSHDAADSTDVSGIMPVNAPSEPQTLFDEPIMVPQVQEAKDETNPIKEIITEPTTQVEIPHNAETGTVKHADNQGSAVDKIVMFYDNGTFEIFNNKSR